MKAEPEPSAPRICREEIFALFDRYGGKLVNKTVLRYFGVKTKGTPEFNQVVRPDPSPGDPRKVAVPTGTADYVHLPPRPRASSGSAALQCMRT